MCGVPTAPALRMTSFLDLTLNTLSLLSIKETPVAFLFSRINLHTSTFVKIVKLSLSRTGSR